MRDPSYYDKARQRVQKKKEFYKNLFSWLSVSVFLLALNAITYSGFWWAFFPIVGWGIGVAYQAIEAFGVPGYSDDWEEREIEAEMERMRRQRRVLNLPPEIPENEDELHLDPVKEKRRNWDESDLV